MTPQDFDLLKVIGCGGYGKVFLAREKSRERVVALKVVSKDELEKQHLQDEIRILENIKSRFLCKMYHSFKTSQKVYMALEFLPGGELFALMERVQFLSENSARFYIAQITLGLDYLHNNHILYRDLKPANVMIDKDGNVKLVDFGMSKFNFPKGNKTSTFCGSMEYMAPEMITEKEYGHAVDLWALGVLLFDLVTGSPPFNGENDEELEHEIRTAKIEFPKGISAECQVLIKSLLVRKEEHRIDISQTKRFDFFKNVDWAELEQGRGNMTPPWKPVLSGEEDVKYFDSSFTNMPLEPVDNDNPFEGFDLAALGSDLNEDSEVPRK
ncbi:hypothetical protein GCK72_011149 [Caenorhabditis remanei]|uniref:Non-specific serine/threonine protein kinase n=1 Tax=Caenorhabditis remanei TaxID=31234 RepID=A0A6A5H705_CAERE|nr:hypothetical protein GCK72_011149 [Caenorhabditis remanei]KAF1762885.1 hypothetical protein GCK72_011149 [Caenorhabditis remanei]